MSNTLPTITETGGLWERTQNRKRFTRNECKFLEQNGLLTERYELIDGEILFKMSQNPPHILTIVLIANWLRRVFGEEYVWSQGTIVIGLDDAEINAPEPDLSVQSLPAVAYATRLPLPSELVLIVEVSDTTLNFDLKNKAALYARAGIVEYWVADVTGRRFILHRSPTPNGYADIVEYAETETLFPLSRPDALVRVADLLPPVPTDN